TQEVFDSIKEIKEFVEQVDSRRQGREQWERREDMLEAEKALGKLETAIKKYEGIKDEECRLEAILREIGEIIQLHKLGKIIPGAKIDTLKEGSRLRAYLNEIAQKVPENELSPEALAFLSNMIQPAVENWLGSIKDNPDISKERAGIERDIARLSAFLALSRLPHSEEEIPEEIDLESFLTEQLKQKYEDIKKYREQSLLPIYEDRWQAELEGLKLELAIEKMKDAIADVKKEISQREIALREEEDKLRKLSAAVEPGSEAQSDVNGTGEPNQPAEPNQVVDANTPADANQPRTPDPNRIVSEPVQAAEPNQAPDSNTPADANRPEDANTPAELTDANTPPDANEPVGTVADPNRPGNANEPNVPAEPNRPADANTPPDANTPTEPNQPSSETPVARDKDSQYSVEELASQRKIRQISEKIDEQQAKLAVLESQLVRLEEEFKQRQELIRLRIERCDAILSLSETNDLTEQFELAKELKSLRQQIEGLAEKKDSLESDLEELARAVAGYRVEEDSLIEATIREIEYRIFEYKQDGLTEQEEQFITALEHVKDWQSGEDTPVLTFSELAKLIGEDSLRNEIIRKISGSYPEWVELFSEEIAGLIETEPPLIVLSNAKLFSLWLDEWFTQVHPHYSLTSTVLYEEAKAVGIEFFSIPHTVMEDVQVISSSDISETAEELIGGELVNFRSRLDEVSQLGPSLSLFCSIFSDVEDDFASKIGLKYSGTLQQLIDLAGSGDTKITYEQMELLLQQLNSLYESLLGQITPLMSSFEDVVELSLQLRTMDKSSRDYLEKKAELHHAQIRLAYKLGMKNQRVEIQDPDIDLEVFYQDILTRVNTEFTSIITRNLPEVGGIREEFQRSFLSRFSVYVSLAYNFSEEGWNPTFPVDFVVNVLILDTIGDEVAKYNAARKEEYRLFKQYLLSVLDQAIDDAKANENDWMEQAFTYYKRELVRTEDKISAGTHPGLARPTEKADFLPDVLKAVRAISWPFAWFSDKPQEGLNVGEVEFYDDLDSDAISIPAQASDDRSQADTAVSFSAQTSLSELLESADTVRVWGEESLDSFISAVINNKGEYDTRAYLRAYRYLFNLMNSLDIWPAQYSTEELLSKITENVKDDVPPQQLTRFIDELRKTRMRHLAETMRSLVYQRDSLRIELENASDAGKAQQLSGRLEATEDEIRAVIEDEDIDLPEVESRNQRVRASVLYDHGVLFGRLDAQRIAGDLEEDESLDYNALIEEAKKVQAEYIADIIALAQDMKISPQEVEFFLNRAKATADDIIGSARQRETKTALMLSFAADRAAEIVTQRNANKMHKELQEQVDELQKESRPQRLLTRITDEVIKDMDVDEPAFLIFKGDSLFEQAVKRVSRGIEFAARDEIADRLAEGLRGYLRKVISGEKGLDRLIDQVALRQIDMVEAIEDLDEETRVNLRKVIFDIFKGDTERYIDAERVLKSIKRNGEPQYILDSLRDSIAEDKIDEFIARVTEEVDTRLLSAQVTLDILNSFMPKQQAALDFLKENKAYLTAEDYRLFETTFALFREYYLKDKDKGTNPLVEIRSTCYRHIDEASLLEDELSSYVKDPAESPFAYLFGMQDKKYDAQVLESQILKQQDKGVSASFLNFSLILLKITFQTDKEKSDHYGKYRDYAGQINKYARQLLEERTYIEVLRFALADKIASQPESLDTGPESLAKYFVGDDIRSYMIGEAAKNHYPDELKELDDEEIADAIEHYQAQAYNTAVNMIFESISAYREYIRHLRQNPHDSTIYLSDNLVTMAAMNAVTLIQNLFSAPDQRQIDKIKDSLQDEIASLSRLTGDDASSYTNGKAARVSPAKKLYIDPSGPYIISDYVSSDGNRHLGFCLPKDRRYTGYYPEGAGMENMRHDVVLREDGPNASRWVEVVSMPVDYDEPDFYHHQDQEIRLNSRTLIPLSEITTADVTHSIVTASDSYGGEADVSQQRFGVELDQDFGDVRYREGMGVFINREGDDRYVFYLDADTDSQHSHFGLELKDGKLTGMLGHSRLFTINGYPGRVAVSYMDENFYLRYNQRYGLWHVEGLVQYDNEEGELILGSEVERDVYNDWRLGGGFKYRSGDDDLLPYIIITKQGLVTDLLSLRLGVDSQGQAAADFRAQKIEGDNQYYLRASLRGDAYSASAGVEHYTPENNRAGMRIDFNSEEDIRALLRYVSDTTALSVFGDYRDEEYSYGVDLEYWLTANNPQTQARWRRQPREDGFILYPAGNILFEKEYADDINEILSLFRKASTERRAIADRQLEELIRRVDDSSVHFLMRLATGAHIEEFTKMLEDFGKLKELKNGELMSSYLGEHSLSDALSFWEYIYWSQKLSTEGDAWVIKRLERYNALQDEVSEFIGQKFDKANPAHMRMLRALVNEGTDASAIRSYLDEASEISDYLKADDLTKIPGCQAIIPELDLTRAEDVQYLFKWVDKAREWDKAGFQPQAILSYLAILLPDFGVAFTKEARAPPCAEDKTPMRDAVDFAIRLYNADRDLRPDEVLRFNYFYNSSEESIKDNELRFRLAIEFSDSALPVSERIDDSLIQIQCVIDGYELTEKLPSLSETKTLARLIFLQYKHNDVGSVLPDMVELKYFFEELMDNKLVIGFDEASEDLYYWAKVMQIRNLSIDEEGGREWQSLREYFEQMPDKLFNGSPQRLRWDDISNYKASMEDVTEELEDEIRKVNSFFSSISSEDGDKVEPWLIEAGSKDSEVYAEFFKVLRKLDKDNKFNDLILSPVCGIDLSDGVDPQEEEQLKVLLANETGLEFSVRVKSVGVDIKSGIIAYPTAKHIVINKVFLTEDTEGIHDYLRTMLDRAALRQQQRERITSFLSMDKSQILQSILVHEFGAYRGFTDEANSELEQRYWKQKSLPMTETFYAGIELPAEGAEIVDEGYDDTADSLDSLQLVELGSDLLAPIEAQDEGFDPFPIGTIQRDLLEDETFLNLFDEVYSYQEWVDKYTGNIGAMDFVGGLGQGLEDKGLTAQDYIADLEDAFTLSDELHIVSLRAQSIFEEVYEVDIQPLTWEQGDYLGVLIGDIISDPEWQNTSAYVVFLEGIADFDQELRANAYSSEIDTYILRDAFGVGFLDGLSRAEFDIIGDEDLGFMFDEDGLPRSSRDSVRHYQALYLFYQALEASPLAREITDTIFINYTYNSESLDLTNGFQRADVIILGTSGSSLIYDGVVSREPQIAVQTLELATQFYQAWEQHPLSSEINDYVFTAYRHYASPESLDFSDGLDEADLVILTYAPYGILWDEEGARDPVKTIEALGGVYGFLEEFRASSLTQEINNYILNAFVYRSATFPGRRLNLSDGLNVIDINILVSEEYGLLFDADGSLKDPAATMDLFEKFTLFYQAWQNSFQATEINDYIFTAFTYNGEHLDLSNGIRIVDINILSNEDYGFFYDIEGDEQDPQATIDLFEKYILLFQAWENSSQATEINDYIFTAFTYNGEHLDLSNGFHLADIKILAVEEYGFFYDEDGVERGPQDVIDFAELACKFKVSWENSAYPEDINELIFNSAFGFDLSDGYQSQELQILGDKDNGIFYDEGGNLRDLDDVMATFSKVVEFYRGWESYSSPRKDELFEFFERVFGVNFQDGINRDELKTLSDIVNGESQDYEYTDPQTFIETLEDVKDLVDALQAADSEDLAFFEQVFSVTLSDGIDPVEYGILAGIKNEALDYEYTTAEEFIATLTKVTDLVAALADIDAEDRAFFEAVFAVTLADGVTDTEYGVLAGIVNGKNEALD
ncbi:MAG: hypothetical protein JRI96_10125, partial [Deltaproteobacteria bacterium]|nr:hypothetical protein [Deltaproteobacteria bacterium]